MEKALVKNAADQEQVKEAGKKEKSGRQRDLDDVYNILQTRGGRRFFYRLIQSAGIFQGGMSPSSDSAFYKEGSRNSGLMVLADLNEADPSSYNKMISESLENNQ